MNADIALKGHRLLEHPFYRRWSMGQVSLDELRAYAAQYRHFERMIPRHLEGIATRSTEAHVQQSARQNLADEVGPERSHAELFEDFADALGGCPEEAPTPAMAALLKTYDDALAAGAGPGFAALWAYEVQSPDVSRTKAGGLRQHYGLEGAGLRFWDVHAEADQQHAQWAADALRTELPDAAHAWSRRAATAWWRFLDEREANARV